MCFLHCDVGVNLVWRVLVWFTGTCWVSRTVCKLLSYDMLYQDYSIISSVRTHKQHITSRGVCKTHTLLHLTEEWTTSKMFVSSESHYCHECWEREESGSTRYICSDVKCVCAEAAGGMRTEHGLCLKRLKGTLGFYRTQSCSS